jgi:hypothetical protein
MPGHADFEHVGLALLGPLVVPQIGIVINAPHGSVFGCAPITTSRISKASRRRLRASVARITRIR